MDNDIKLQLDRIESYARLASKNVLTIDEAVTLTGLSKQRIYALCSQREIPHYKQGKLYFRKDELENWMTAYRRPTQTEVTSAAMIRDLSAKKLITHN